jgi:hypothetical protein
MMRLDVAYMPTQDHWGNSTLGYLQPEPVPTGSPYAGYQRVDTPTAISIASTNAADNAATATRNDTVYNPVIYTIGLGGTDPQPIDAVFMERVANDPRSPIYDSTKSAGMFVYASDINQLGIAFRTIASQILRLSQ